MVILRVTTLMVTYNPIQVLVTIVTKSHDPLSTGTLYRTLIYVKLTLCLQEPYS